MAASPPSDDRYAAFRHRAFNFYFAARFLSGFALETIIVAVGWQIYDLTRDPFDLGLVGLIQFLPALVLLLATGSAADRYSRRGIILIADLIMASGAAALLVLTWNGLTSVLPIFAVLLVFGVARAFLGPAAQALAPNLVPARDLPNAVAWNSSAWQTASVVGPVAGGLLYGIGPSIPYFAGAAMLLAAGILIWQVPRQPRRMNREPQSWSSLLAGFRYIRRERVVLGAISLDLFAVLLGGAVAMMPVYARDILVLGPVGLGLLRASPGIGAILMAVYLASRPIRRAAGVKMFIAVGLFGLATLIFGLSTSLPLSLLALILLGAADTISVYVRQSLVQLWTPDELLGRVSAVNMVFVGASNELGDFRAGSMAAVIGPVLAVTLGGLSAFGIAGLWAYAFPELRRIQSLDRDREMMREGGD
ncbi:MFS transporter [Pseudohoeflea coraliihabitans]|uniref:MFS transporter n=1 Tax=Pseudohoeflea coraliihabitans TaxID=2860393 RepID=A0ABS6WLF1_9HYPH|nr:MFS transporter [Pseudohoeflea sp. DP4N28-3]MBW3096786.1 MFS transporter [Pseudohoeflea sp. DP4N28-3]